VWPPPCMLALYRANVDKHIGVLCQDACYAVAFEVAEFSVPRNAEGRFDIRVVEDVLGVYGVGCGYGACCRTVVETNRAAFAVIDFHSIISLPRLYVWLFRGAVVHERTYKIYSSGSVIRWMISSLWYLLLSTA